ncbi:hypothetical protein JCM10914A_28880 [Paenibacillus sp. JCM 10914]|uniref:DUF4097 family beta strand repeat-containing protein n=1 Tax=Paenibacillus sp. JCM 10914 TaxID=1236974 RepID=UPI0009DDCF75|nr:DUF4097 family beta strand repeat-containing protein [Paenibacillus sp. JCM 10914]
MMKKHMAWVSLVLLLLLSIATIVGVNSLFTADFNESTSIEAQHIKDITISSDITDIYLSLSSDHQVHARITGTASKLSDYGVFLLPEDDHLHIRAVEKNAAVSSLSLNKSVRLQIDLPADKLRNVTVQSKFGSVYAEQPLMADTFKFKSNLGGMYLDSYTGQELTADSTLGNIQIMRLEGNASLTTGSGHVTIAKWQPLTGHNRILTNKGNIEVGLTPPSQALFFHIYSNGIVRTDLDASFTSVPASFSRIGMNQIAGNLGETADHGARLEISSDTGKIVVNNK